MRWALVEPDVLSGNFFHAFSRKISTLSTSPISMATKLGPDLNRISSLIFHWRRGFLSFEEVERGIRILTQPENHVPESELLPELGPTNSTEPTTNILKRIEGKLNLTIKQLGIALPESLNPEILSPEAAALADENRKIEAVAHHCASTGIGLAAAKSLVEEYIRKRNQ